MIDSRNHWRKLLKLHVEGVLHLKLCHNWVYKIYLCLLSGFMYTASLSVDSLECYLTIAGKVLMALYLKCATRWLKNAQMAYLLLYIVIKQIVEYKTKVFTFKHSLNRGIHLSLSAMNMQTSIIQVLLMHICLIVIVIVDVRIKAFAYTSKEIT